MRRIFHIVLVSCLILFTACSNAPKEDSKKAQAIKTYCTYIQDDAFDYFTKLTEEAIGTKPEEVRVGFRNVDMDYLTAEPKKLMEILDESYPVLLVGIVCGSGKNYSDEEIHEMIVNVKNQDITVDLYFDYNDYYVYQIREDGVTIDITTAKDGGAMHELVDYEL